MLKVNFQIKIAQNKITNFIKKYYQNFLFLLQTCNFTSPSSSENSSFDMSLNYNTFLILETLSYPLQKGFEKYYYITIKIVNPYIFRNDFKFTTVFPSSKKEAC